MSAWQSSAGKAPRTGAAPSSDWFRLHDPECPATVPELPAGPPGVPGQPLIPGYEIEGELGRGGMGVVYKARQTSLDRIVALKMLLAGSGEAHLVRFRAEAEAIARLQHPHIVQIYEVGEWAGLPYFTLEYVDGGHLGEHLKRGGPQAPAAAAGLVETLARTVQVAHERGIIHRDLKPANVLLTRDGTPKIADFGLAKRLEAGNRTGSGQLMGTPVYMAPEQLNHSPAAPGPAAGPAVDIYALGVILYELLTGRPPFEGACPADLLFQVTLREPIPPSYWARGTPRDLETITLKCLEKDPHKRYQSAAALADDLAAFGQGRPIKARPVGPVERFRRWCGKHRVVAALSAAVVLLLLSTTFALGVGFVRVQREQTRTEAARRDALASERQALASEQQVRAALRREARRRRQARTALDALSEGLDDLLAHLPHLNDQHRRLLRTAQRLYEEQVAEATAEEADRLDAARGHLRLAHIRYRLGEHAAAQKHYARSLLLLGRVAAASGRPDHREELAAAHTRLAVFLKAIGRPAPAEAEHLHARALRARLAEDFPAEPAHRKALAQTDTSLGVLRAEQNRPADAEKAFRSALALRRKLAAERPRDTACREDLADAHGNLALLLLPTKRHADTAEQYRAALAVYKGLRTDFPHSARYRNLLATAHNNLGTLYQRIGQDASAEQQYRAALPVWAELARQLPGQADYAACLGGVYCNLGNLAGKSGRREESLTWYDQAQRVLQPLHARLPRLERARRFLFAVHLGRAHIYTQLGRHAEALPDWERALSLCADPGLANMLRLRRTFALVWVGQPGLALPGAGEIDLARTPANELADLAAAFCAAGRGVDSGLRQRLHERALALIRAAHKRGLFKDPAPAAWLGKEDRLAPLRDFPEFRAILAEIKAHGVRPARPTP
jgi:tetratricopeptide (TPR) repeat protein/tRNA A-37 threonylcarbamoyl transferase component Bud32